jgi:dTDP-4-amino-4,6-dideoxygalactose transaminase
MDAIMTLCDNVGIPVIEDAAHSLGTMWRGRKIGTIGRVGCFSFQSYKMINAGEGGILITDDADLVARAIIMSGAYEHNWQKHPVLHEAFARWQNRLPLYNLRLNNLSAVLIRPQLCVLSDRVRRGRRNHDFVAARLNSSPHIDVPAPLEGEERAPDSIQFNLIGLDTTAIHAFVGSAAQAGIKVQVFGQSADNARAFWNWQFLKEIPDLPQTRKMLMSACDVRLPVQLEPPALAHIADLLLAAIAHATARRASAVA